MIIVPQRLLCIAAAVVFSLITVLGARASTSIDAPTLDTIIRAVTSNEANIASVQAAGTYQTTTYDEYGTMLHGERGQFRFYRRASLIRIDLTRQYWGVKDSATEQAQSNWASIGSSINFYDPSTNIVISPGSDVASVGEPSMPPVFPISFGYWARPVGSMADMWQFSRDLRQGLSSHCLSVKPKDPDHPADIVLEVTNSHVRVRWWIDPNRGFLVARCSEYAQLPKSAPSTGPTEALILEEVSTLERTNSFWYAKSGVRKSYAPVLESNQLEFRLKEEERIQVSEFGELSSIKPDEVGFSLEHFPYVRHLYDFMNDRVTDLKPPVR